VTDNMTYGRVLYDNAFNDAGVSLLINLCTEVSGFPREYAVDWRDFTFFRAETVTGGTPAGTALWLYMQPSADRIIDSIGWWVKPTYEPASGRQLVQVVHNYGATYEPLYTVDLYSDGLMGLKTFTPRTIGASDYLIAVMYNYELFGSYPWDVRAIAIGNHVQFPIGQHVGIAPPAFQRQAMAASNVSVEGSHLGRDVLGHTVSGTIDLEYLRESFVDDEWVPFLEHARTKPFFYQWDADDHELDCVIAQATDIEPASNTMPNPRMTARMAWRGLRK